MAVRKAIKAEARWLASFPHRHKVMIAGNHDFWLQEASVERAYLKVSIIS